MLLCVVFFFGGVSFVWLNLVVKFPGLFMAFLCFFSFCSFNSWFLVLKSYGFAFLEIFAPLAN